MTTTVLCHWDGKVFIPEEPVDLPINVPLLATITLLTKEQAEALREQRRAERETKQPLPPA